MCLGIPMEILGVDGFTAQCRAGSEVHRIDLSLLPEARPGDHVLTFLGAGRRLLDAEEARLIAQALDAVTAAMNGQAPDIEHAFADLIGREPSLPDHLVPLVPPHGADCMTLEMLHPLVARLTSAHGYPYLDSEEVAVAVLPPGDSLLFLPAHGKAHRETPDIAVVLPELVGALSAAFALGGAVAGPAYEKRLCEQLGGIAVPAIVVMRDGRPLGSLSRMRDWDEFLTRLSAVLAGPADATRH